MHLRTDWRAKLTFIGPSSLDSGMRNQILTRNNFQRVSLVQNHFFSLSLEKKLSI